MFNAKVNKDGSYRNFLGYTTLAMAKTDISFIESYIKNSPYLSKYYSPLSISPCYHHLFIHNYKRKILFNLYSKLY